MSTPAPQTEADNHHDSKLKSLLKECASKRRTGDAAGCLESALKAAQLSPSHPRAIRNLCWSLYALRRYNECLQACRDGVQMLSTVEMSHSMRQERFLIRRMQAACQLCLRLERNDLDRTDKDAEESVTGMLIRGWYAHQLRKMIKDGHVSDYPMVEFGNADRDTRGETLVVMNKFQTRQQLYRSTSGRQDCCIVLFQRDRSIQINDQGEMSMQYPGGGYIALPDGTTDLPFGFPCDQATGGNVFLKDAIVPFHCYDNFQNSECYLHGSGPCRSCVSWWEYPYPTHPFPKWFPEQESSSTAPEQKVLRIHEPQHEMDVYYSTNCISSETKDLLTQAMDRLSRIRSIKTVSSKHTVIDPNVGAHNGLWVPTELMITEEVSPKEDVLLSIELLFYHVTNQRSFLPSGFAKRIAAMAGNMPRKGKCQISSPIPDLDPHDHTSLYLAVEDLFEKSLPLLTRLNCPSLLLPGPLQVVIKAETLSLRQGETTTASPWIEEELEEHVLAVLIYFYRSSPNLLGGEIEIASKTRKFRHQEDFDFAEAKLLVEEIQRCKIPVEEGTLLAFGNYAAVHRFLATSCQCGGETSDECGSRDYLAFYIIDQRKPLPNPKHLGPYKERKANSHQLQSARLVPKGSFCIGSIDARADRWGAVAPNVAVGWNLINEENQPLAWNEESDCGQSLYSHVMNAKPSIIGRGVSHAVANLPELRCKIDAGSHFEQHVIDTESGHNIVLLVDLTQFRYGRWEEELTVSSAKRFSTQSHWWEAAGQELFTTDRDLAREVQAHLNEL